MLDKNFFPTPKNLINKMLAKIKNNPEKILEPSAGKGDIVDALKDSGRTYGGCRYEISAIEKDETLIATLRGKGTTVIDSDFLLFSAPDKFDLIIANPPFDRGGEHLLKAIDIMYRGQIIFLLNAETVKKSHTKTKQLLARKLKEFGADIEYHTGMLQNAERKTNVEVALIDITIDRKIEDDLFDGVVDRTTEIEDKVKDNQELSTGLNVKELVAEYNQIVKIGTETLIGYYKNHNKIGRYIGINRKAEEYESEMDLTGKMQWQLNKFLKVLRTDFWKRTLELKEVKNRLTEKKRSEFETQIDKVCDMDFTENNIRAFVLNLINNYEKTLTEAVLDIFDLFTIRHKWDGGDLHEKNIHYFNGWKTNKAFKVGKKVIIPVNSSYANSFIDWDGWKLNYTSERFLSDIDIVMNYFDGMSDYISIADALTSGFKTGENKGLRSSYFTITAHKKGTIHLTFNSDDILRRFNIAACKGKKWLSESYGSKGYKLLTESERGVVDSFENKKSYDKNLNQKIFDCSKPELKLLTE